MAEIVWTDVQGSLPRPLQAHDAADSDQKHTVNARLWQLPSRPQPYQLSFLLRLQGSIIEKWEADFTDMAAAFAAYTRTQQAAERWLQGAALKDVRPRFQR